MNCLTCDNPHDGSYGSGRFCSEHCAKKHSRSLRKKEVDEKIKRTIIKMIHNADLLPEDQIYICEYGCGQRAKVRLANGKVCCSYLFMKCSEVRKKNSEGLKKDYEINGTKARRSIEEYKETNKKLGDQRVEQQSLLAWDKTNPAEKRRRILLKQKGKCAFCGIPSEWNNKPLVLQLDHVDGNRFNDTEENLRILCPNCHTQTDTYVGKGTGRKNSRYNKKVDDNILLDALNKTTNIYQALRLCGLSGGGNYARMIRLKLEQKYCPRNPMAEVTDCSRSVQEESCTSNPPNSVNSSEEKIQDNAEPNL